MAAGDGSMMEGGAGGAGRFQRGSIFEARVCSRTPDVAVRSQCEGVSRERSEERGSRQRATSKLDGRWAKKSEGESEGGRFDVTLRGPIEVVGDRSWEISR